MCHVIEQAQHNYPDKRKKSSFVQKTFPAAGWEPEVSKWQLSVSEPHLLFQKLLFFLIYLSICGGRGPRQWKRLFHLPHLTPSWHVP